jgi:hypothetical protein
MNRTDPVELPVLHNIHPKSRKASQLRRKANRDNRIHLQNIVEEKKHRQVCEPYLWFKATLMANQDKQCYTPQEADALVDEYSFFLLALYFSFVSLFFIFRYFEEKFEKLRQKQREMKSRQGKINNNKRIKCEIFEQALTRDRFVQTNLREDCSFL